MLKRHFLGAVVVLCALPAMSDSHGADADMLRVAGAIYQTQDRDMKAAEQIFRKSCRACHGNKGQGASSFPQISDKAPQYIAEKLEIYRSGEKIGPNSILMIQHAKKLSDDDIANIAVYVATAFE